MFVRFPFVFIYLIGGGGVCVRNLAVASTSISNASLCLYSPGQTIFLQKIRFEKKEREKKKLSHF